MTSEIILLMTGAVIVGAAWLFSSFVGRKSVALRRNGPVSRSSSRRSSNSDGSAHLIIMADQASDCSDSSNSYSGSGSSGSSDD